mgnify:CR=1 FL=1
MDVALTADEMKALDEVSKLTLSIRRGWIRSDRTVVPANAGNDHGLPRAASLQICCGVCRSDASLGVRPHLTGTRR